MKNKAPNRLVYLLSSLELNNTSSYKNKQAFSFVEIIIVISIIALLSVMALTYYSGQSDKSINAKVESDIATINNSLLYYIQENQSLPAPGGNNNYFTNDGAYAHSKTATGTFGVYGNFTEDTMPKKYLNILPLDPRTNSYYAYGKTISNYPQIKNQFEIAGVKITDETYQAKVSGNYTAEYGLYNLIREYNGSNFVYDNSNTNLPYNPEELILTATANGKIYREGDTIKADSGDLEIYFSDGSVSILENGGELTLSKLSFPKENNLSTLVKLALKSGTLWTKATKLDEGSEFEIYTTDSTAAVRGTIFGISKDTDKTAIQVLEGEIGVYEAKVEEKPGTNQLMAIQSVAMANTIFDIDLSQAPNNTPKILTAGKSLEIEAPTQDKTSFEIIESKVIQQITPVFKTQIEQKVNSIGIQIDIREKHEGNTAHQMALENFKKLEEENIDPVLADCDGTAHGSTKNFWTTDSIAYDPSISVCPDTNKIQYTCNNGKWMNGTSEVTNPISTCIVGTPSNCVANTSYAYNDHYYNIPALTHNDTPQTYTSSNISENNGTFKYNISLKCNNGDYDQIAETTAQLIACDTQYTKNDTTGNTCMQTIVDREDSDKKYQDKWNGTEYELWAITECKDSAYEINHTDLTCDLIPTGPTLFASVDFNNTGDGYGNLIKTDGSLYSTPIERSVLSSNSKDLPDYCDEDDSNEGNSYCVIGDTKGIYIDNTGGDDFVKYSGLSLNKDDKFEIEMKIRYINDDTKKHYLLHSKKEIPPFTSYIQLFIDEGKLYFNNYGGTDELITDDISDGFSTIKLINESGDLKIKVGNDEYDINKSLSNNIDLIYIGAWKRNSTQYGFQLDDIIDYIKIYK